MTWLDIILIGVFVVFVSLLWRGDIKRTRESGPEGDK